MLKRTFRIPNMECPNCAMRLEGLEDRLPGVKQISASYRKLEMVVEYDEALLNQEQIIAAALEEGYQAVPI
jgi:copper chaperone CopZ